MGFGEVAVMLTFAFLFAASVSMNILTRDPRGFQELGVCQVRGKLQERGTEKFEQCGLELNPHAMEAGVFKSPRAGEARLAVLLRLFRGWKQCVFYLRSWLETHLFCFECLQVFMKL
jgi:hypothetical protein